MKALFSETNLTTGKTETREIKLCDGFRIEYDGENERFETLEEVFKAIHWDTDDGSTKQAREIVWRELWCFGFVDLTPYMPKGHTLVIRAIPVKEG